MTGYPKRDIKSLGKKFSVCLIFAVFAGCSKPPEDASESLKNYLLEGEGRELLQKIIEEEWERTGTQRVEKSMKEIILKRGDPAEKPLEELMKNRQSIAVGQSPFQGPADAPITIIEFVDYKDPNSLTGMIRMGQLLEEFPGQVRWVVKNNPLSIYKNNEETALASLAAHQQGKFWDWHTRAMSRQLSHNEAEFKRWAEEFKIDWSQFASDRKSPRLKQQLQTDKELAKTVGAGVPSYFVNGVHILGAQPAAVFREVIHALLKEGAANKRP